MVVIWTDCCTYICPAACSSAAAHNPYAIRFIAIELDFLYTVIQNPSKQLIRRSCHAPPVLFRPCDGQSMGFCCLLKVLVVICPSSAAILYIDDFIIVLMTHFVQKGTDSVSMPPAVSISLIRLRFCLAFLFSACAYFRPPWPVVLLRCLYDALV